MSSEPKPPSTFAERAAWILMGLTLMFVMVEHLLPALLAGLLVFELVHQIAARLPLGAGSRPRAKAISVLVIGALAVLLVGGIIGGVAAFFRSEEGSLPALLQRMAEILGNSRPMLPEWLGAYLPADPAVLQTQVGAWLREHAGELEHAGAEVGRLAAHVLVGLIIGAMVALHEASDTPGGPLAVALGERAARLAESFRRVVFAQVRIAALNAAFTGIFLLIALPLLGVELPLRKTMVVVTFVAGLIPVLGNLISNGVIVIVSSSVSPQVAAGALVFLVVIHKLEYFLNARIVGSQVKAHAWELLLAMLAMETAFGVAGVVFAPILYAYVKDELGARGLV